MGLFDRKKKEKDKEKNTSFRKRKQAPQGDIRILTPDEEIAAEADRIAAEALQAFAEQEQDETEKARQEAESATQLEETRQEAIELARKAAMGEELEEANDDDADDEDIDDEDEDGEDADNEDTDDAGTDDEDAGHLENTAKKGLFAKLRAGLKKTKDAMMSRIQGVLSQFTKIDDDLFDELEETLIMSDLGPETSVEICNLLRERVKERNVTDPNEIMGMIQEIIAEMLGEDETLTYPTKPTIILVIGVNGAGKTTTIGKLCYQLKNEGKNVLVAAADTFRAAAIDQLEVWTNRAGADLIKHEEGSGPGAVIYDAISAAKARKSDVLICDTAGRLHNKKNLMQELSKINRIITTKAEDSHVEVLLVLDATTGQNAVNQARLFQETADITGIVLTKLDGTAKGGIVVSIRNELGIPVKLIGVGEKIEDLQPFHSVDFVKALFSSNEEVL